MAIGKTIPIEQNIALLHANLNHIITFTAQLIIMAYRHQFDWCYSDSIHDHLNVNRMTNSNLLKYQAKSNSNE